MELFFYGLFLQIFFLLAINQIITINLGYFLLRLDWWNK